MANEDEKVEICRLCGKESRNCFPIFQDEDNILEKINICLPIDISPDDKLPSSLCRCCSYRLSISYELRCTAIEVDERLRMQLYQRQSDVYTNKDTNNFSENFLNIKRKIIDEENVLHYQNDIQEIRDKINIDNDWKTNREDIDEISNEMEIVTSMENNETAASVNSVNEIDIVEMKYEDVIEASIEKTDNISDFVKNKTANDCQRFSEHQTLEQNSSALAEHIREIHDLQSPNKLNTKEKYVCKFCDKKFNSWRLWKNHERIHTEETLNSKCHKSFRSNRSISHHIQREHKKKEYVCDQCGKCYSSYNSRWHHVQREHKKKEYVCDQCGKCFR
ncbi:PREDICTED: myoneurin-like isoform X2 [Wasmannia auropunctata]|uniref:myoneurin-like isoform X2 n=1 Tax=Wasmannia auropunctata TaxID=64793 RepID=UPI0005EEE0D9|nr:PREDICTED: myoneurin-like isoform X2 [Wasmannia auropunctata]